MARQIWRKKKRPRSRASQLARRLDETQAAAAERARQMRSNSAPSASAWKRRKHRPQTPRRKPGIARAQNNALAALQQAREREVAALAEERAGALAAVASKYDAQAAEQAQARRAEIAELSMARQAWRREGGPRSRTLPTRARLTRRRRPPPSACASRGAAAHRARTPGSGEKHGLSRPPPRKPRLRSRAKNEELAALQQKREREVAALAEERGTRLAAVLSKHTRGRGAGPGQDGARAANGGAASQT